MPIYVYRCRSCGEEFEKLILSANGAGEVECPTCQGRDVERRPALFGIGGTSRRVTSSGSSCGPTTGSS